MKNIRNLLSIGTLALTLASLNTLVAQIGPGPMPGPGEPMLRPDVPPPLPIDRTTMERPGRVIRPELPPRPEIGTRPERPELPAEVKALLADFEQARKDFLATQKGLLQDLRAATTDADRAALREQLKAARDAWLESTKELRESIKQALAEIRPRLSTRQELLDQVRENRDNAHPRRGSVNP